MQKAYFELFKQKFTQKHIYWQKHTDAKFGNRITVKSPSVFLCDHVFQKRHICSKLKVKRCLQKEWGVSYAMTP